MNRRSRMLAASAMLVAFTLDAGSAAAATNGERCAAAKMKTSAKYASCRLAADSKATSSGEPADYTKCDEKQEGDWTKIETKYGVECLTSGDQASVKSNLTAAADCVSDLLSGTSGSCSFAMLPPCPPTGVVIDGTCWLMGNTGDSCTATCALEGLAYDTKTDTYAGTNSGSIGNCLSIQAALGHPHSTSFFIQGPPEPIGCSNNGSVFLIGGSVTAQANYSGFARVCGCS